MCTLLTRLKRYLFEILWHPDLHHANRLQPLFAIMFFHPVVEAGTETATSSRIPTALFHTLSKSEEQPVTNKILTPTKPIKILFFIILSSDVVMELRLF